MIDDMYYFSIGMQWYYWVFNVLTFFVYAWDKRRAVFKHRRIPEFVLLLLAILGGALGAFCSMILFNHKLRKPKFYITVPILLLFQLISYGLLCWFDIL